MEAQRFFEFLISAWAKPATPSLDQMVSARKLLDSNVQAKEVDRERGAWKKYYLEKLMEQEDECERSLSCTKAGLERENEACLVEHTHKQSAKDYVRAEIVQTSSEAAEAIAHLAEDTIGSIKSTVTRNDIYVRSELYNIVRENLPANGGGR